MSVVLETARAFDAPAIATILSDWIDETEWMPRIHTREQDQGFGRRLVEVTDVMVAREDGDVIGFLARRQHDIHSLYLERSARRRGIGALLLDHAKSAQPHLELWTFQSNDGARKFYAKKTGSLKTS